MSQEPFIRLQREGTSVYVDGRTQGYRMRITAFDAAGGIPNEIFVYQRQPYGAVFSDQFTNIASPADVQEYPILMPDPGGVFYRLAQVDLIFRNLALANDAWAGIKNDVDQLIQTLEFLETLEVQEIVDFGSSSSSSSSSSA